MCLIWQHLVPSSSPSRMQKFVCFCIFDSLNNHQKKQKTTQNILIPKETRTEDRALPNEAHAAMPKSPTGDLNTE